RVQERVAQRNTDPVGEVGTKLRFDAVRERRAHVRVVHGVRQQQGRRIRDQVPEPLVEIRHGKWPALGSDLPAEGAFRLEMRIAAYEPLREVLEKRGFFEAGAGRDFQARAVGQSVDDAYAIGPVAAEL